MGITDETIDKTGSAAVFGRSATPAEQFSTEVRTSSVNGRKNSTVSLTVQVKHNNLLR